MILFPLQYLKCGFNLNGNLPEVPSFHYIIVLSSGEFHKSFQSSRILHLSQAREITLFR